MLFRSRACYPVVSRDTSKLLARMKPLLRVAEVSDASVASELVQRTFNAFVAPDWEPEARSVFMSQSSSERLSSIIREATFAAVAESKGRVVGFILLSPPNVLAFLFVHAHWHRRGIARDLWERACKHIEAEHPAIKTIELNSSPYAIGAYKALGFYPISEPFRRGGCFATRMACWLPGKALNKAANAEVQLGSSELD